MPNLSHLTPNGVQLDVGVELSADGNLHPDPCDPDATMTWAAWKHVTGHCSWLGWIALAAALIAAIAGIALLGANPATWWAAIAASAAILSVAFGIAERICTGKVMGECTE